MRGQCSSDPRTDGAVAVQSNTAAHQTTVQVELQLRRAAHTRTAAARSVVCPCGRYSNALLVINQHSPDSPPALHVWNSPSAENFSTDWQWLSCKKKPSRLQVQSPTNNIDTPQLLATV